MKRAQAHISQTIKLFVSSGPASLFVHESFVLFSLSTDMKHHLCHMTVPLLVSVEERLSYLSFELCICCCLL
eukprot:m.73233 g.73233  ORF g.73233 m.73233 type:complete len:72 (+) comp13883_c0_seq1:425-640(+)